MFNIRKAQEYDAPQLVELLKQLSPKFDMSLAAMKSRIIAFESPGHSILVAERQSAILGVIAFGCYEQFRYSGKCCHIDALVIDMNVRGQGIGKHLMACVEKYAKENGVVSLELITANHRRESGTHAFYESQGFKDHNFLDYSYYSKPILV